MKTKFNLLRKLLPYFAIWLAIDGLCYIGNNKTEYVNSRPGITKPECIRTYAGEGGLNLFVRDPEKRREVIFRDEGYDGTLDQVRVQNSDSEEVFEDPYELKKWQEDYIKIRNLASRN